MNLKPQLVLKGLHAVLRGFSREMGNQLQNNMEHDIETGML